MRVSGAQLSSDDLVLTMTAAFHRETGQGYPYWTIAYTIQKNVRWAFRMYSYSVHCVHSCSPN